MMAIQISRAIFLHIPKTGGTWITHYFKESGMDHEAQELAELAHMNGVKLKSLIGKPEDLVFCFVRHPLTWFRSYWQCKQVLIPRLGGYLDTIVDLPFKEFIDKMLDEYPGYLEDFTKGYLEVCRAIGKQENLRNDLNSILTMLRIPYDKELLYSKPFVNKVESNERFTIDQALAIMYAERDYVERFDYNYLPTGVIEGV